MQVNFIRAMPFFKDNRRYSVIPQQKNSFNPIGSRSVYKLNYTPRFIVRSYSMYAPEVLVSTLHLIAIEYVFAARKVFF